MKIILRRLIPDRVVRGVRKLRLQVAQLMMLFCSRNRYLSGLYYLLNSGFAREHQSVLKGRIAYYKSLNDISISCPLLRRNIHRLEKGLVMKPRRNIFAESFILETVRIYNESVVSKKVNQEEIKWAKDVLDEYFKVVGISNKIEEARIAYGGSICVQDLDFDENLNEGVVNYKYKPYQYLSIDKSDIEFDELKKLFLQRRSVRWYTKNEIPAGIVEQAANIASLAPSACNRQPYRFVFCNKKSKVVEIAQCAGGTAGFSENIPAIIAVVGDLSAYPYERDRHLIYIDGALAAMQLMLALETLGLSSCSINWPEVEFREKKLRKTISLQDYERVVMLLSVGYADDSGGVPYSQKKTKSMIFEDIGS